MRVLTFDVEDWFHVLDNEATDSATTWPRLESRVERNTVRILDELGERGVRATFFCLGWVAEHHPRLVRRIAAEGHEVGTHSYAHLPVCDASRDAFEPDLKRSLCLLEDLIGRPVSCYRAPGATLCLHHAWAIDALLAHGIEVDCSIPLAGLGRCGHGPVDGPATIAARGGCLRELPLGGERAFGVNFRCCSSGYFRASPYAVVRRQLRQRSYVMSYVHPRDFDPDQPTVDGLSRLRRMKARVGLSTAWSRFRRLLDEFEFVNVGEAVRQVDWRAAPVLLPRGAPAEAAAW
jgi:polysaccharide deacetylase family protein (PEP-CTERM system associated)